MMAPSHPGELIAENLDELGLSTAKAAEAMGITRQQLHNVMTGRSAISSEMALRLELAFGGSAEMWLRLQASHDLTKLRASEASLGVNRLKKEST